MTSTPEPASIRMDLWCGVDWDFEFPFFDDERETIPSDLTGYTGEYVAMAPGLSDPVISMTVGAGLTIDEEGGIVSGSLTWEDTALIPARVLDFQLRLISPTNRKTLPFEGLLYAHQGLGL